MAISMHPQTLRRFAAHSELLHYLDDSGLARLAKVGELRHVPARQVVLAEGEVSCDLYLLAAGELKVAMRETPSGEVARLHDGAFFGEMAFIDRQPRSATVTTVVNCQVVRFAAADVAAIFADYPAVQTLLGRIGAGRREANSARRQRNLAAGTHLPHVDDYLAAAPATDDSADSQSFRRQATPPPGILPPSRRLPPKV